MTLEEQLAETTHVLAATVSEERSQEAEERAAERSQTLEETTAELQRARAAASELQEALATRDAGAGTDG